MVSTRAGESNSILAKTELQELGEETDDMAVSTSKLREQILALSGVDIMIDENTFKSTYDILLEMSDAFTRMSDIQKAATGELLAGKNRSNALYAILQNAKDLKDVYESAMDAEGSAMEENERFMQSIDGHLQQLSNTWQKVWVDTINSDLIKGIIDLGNNILKIVDDLGGLDSILLSIGTTIGLLNLEKISAMISNMGTKIVELFTAVKQGLAIFKSFETAREAVQAVTEAEEEATAVARVAAYVREMEAAGLVKEGTAAMFAEAATKKDTVATEANTAAKVANKAALLTLKNVIGLVAGAVMLGIAAMLNIVRNKNKRPKKQDNLLYN